MRAEQLHQLIVAALKIKPDAIERKIAAFIDDKVQESGAKGVVIGLSGGVDSSVTAFLCAKALGKKNVIGITMPETGVTDLHEVYDAKDVASQLGIEFKVVDITPMLSGMEKNLADYRASAPIANANIRARVRMVILYYYANLLNRLVIGCGNRSELRAGYFTKYGDGGVDLMPVGSLYKTQVRQLAAHLGVPKHIIEKVPTAGLWPGQTDEGELGITYEKLDMIYAGLDLGLKLEDIAKSVGVEIEKVKHFIEREQKAAHKLRVPEVPKL